MPSDDRSVEFCSKPIPPKPSVAAPTASSSPSDAVQSSPPKDQAKKKKQEKKGKWQRKRSGSYIVGYMKSSQSL